MSIGKLKARDPVILSHCLVCADNSFLPGEVRQSLLDMEQTFGLLDRKSSLSNGGKLLYDPSVMGTNITLQNVKFSYPGRTDHPILNGIDLDIAGGKTVALVGSSGCGKSTILRLLYRFYDPTNDDGIITVGSHKTLDLNLESLRRNIAVVPQDTVLFHDSIFYNLSYGASKNDFPKWKSSHTDDLFDSFFLDLKVILIVLPRTSLKPQRKQKYMIQ